MSDLERLKSLLPSQLKKLVIFIGRNGFSVGLVGGSVRNYFLDGDPGKDFDLEIRPLEHVPDLLSLYQGLKQKLKSVYDVEVLNYQVLRLKIEDFECEISLPRIEHFTDELHHSNFDAEFISDMDYSNGFKRRDFTLNAMLVKLGDKLALIDPLNGKDDLLKKELVPCSEDFHKDPVRYLRSIRFATKYNFKISKSILDKLNGNKDLKFSDHYLRLEAKKSYYPLTFYQNLLNLWKGESFNLDQSLVQDYEVNFQHLKFKDFINFAIFLPQSFQDSLKDLISFKFQFISQTHFKNKVLNLEEVNTFKKMSSLPSDVLNFYFEHNYFDLNSDDLIKMKEFSVDLNDVEPKERACFEINEKLRRLSGN